MSAPCSLHTGFRLPKRGGLWPRMAQRMARYIARRWARPLGGLLLLAAGLLATGCAAQPSHDAPAQATPHRIHVVRHGWHSGIVVRAADVPEDAWPARREFAGAEYLEVGWGDRAYYQAPDPSVWLGLRALLWPTPGVLHMAAFSGPVQTYFPAAEIVALQITTQGLARLVAAIAASHELDAAGRPMPLGPGLYGSSRFYASREPFHLFATCNVWTAAMLRHAGVPVSPVLSQTSGALFAQLRSRGLVLQAAP
ncbi:MAG: DUF2459 domain-containing protein [Rubrivivax sp.]|nr:DUF2459 domain-containing protein [Rubrivivax sp.]